MIVRFVFAGDLSYYSFSDDFMGKYCSQHNDICPYGVRNTYGRDTDMFNFLDSVIYPSCLERITTTIGDDGSYVVLLYDVSHIPLDDMERFFIPLDALPF